jgi:hypothetical protein
MFAPDAGFGEERSVIRSLYGSQDVSGLQRLLKKPLRGEKTYLSG